MTSWQGKDGPAHIDTLDEIGPGRYRITEPIHVDGTWKTTLRLHKGRELAGLPIFLPADPAIPVSEVPVSRTRAPAPSSSTIRTCSASRRRTSRAG